MTDFLIKKFVPDWEKTDDISVREKYGALSSFTGIICNVILFALKFAVGTISGSISVMSDAFNNLSDSASCIVTLIGYKLAAKPADKDHPFGHGRAEYLTSLIIAVIIILVGFELFKTSVMKIMSPTPVIFSIAAVISLAASILVKLWLSSFNKTLGTKIRSSVMLAAAQDSKNDVIATAAALLGLTAALFTDLPVDGVMGVIVSVFVLKAGFEIVRDTVDDLLGKPADSELVKQIEQMVTAPEKIIGIHDLVVHDYGPGRMLASCHVEVRGNEDFYTVHEIVDTIERDIMEKLSIIMTIHMDPVDADNEQVKITKARIAEYIESLDSRLSLHDFRMVSGTENINVIFDVVVPYDCTYADSQIKEKITDYLNSDSDVEYHTVITFDRDFSGR